MQYTRVENRRWSIPQELPQLLNHIAIEQIGDNIYIQLNGNILMVINTVTKEYEIGYTGSG